MTNEEEPKVSAKRYPSRSTRMLVRAIWITGLVLPILTGLIAMFILQSRGIPTVGLSDGFGFVIPLTIFFGWPFAIFAWIAIKIFKSVSADDRSLWVGWSIVLTGALLGLTIAVGSSMIEPMLYHGPGGFAEAISMMMMLWMFTLPVLLAWSIGGVIIGGIIGALFALGVSFLFPRWFSGK